MKISFDNPIECIGKYETAMFVRKDDSYINLLDGVHATILLNLYSTTRNNIPIMGWSSQRASIGQMFKLDPWIGIFNVPLRMIHIRR